MLSERPRILLAALAVAALAAGCSGGPAPGEGGQSAAAPADGDRSLRGVCPATVVIQTSWFQHVYGGNITLCMRRAGSGV